MANDAESLPVEDGQFDDAPEETRHVASTDNAPVVDPRQGHNFIDEEQLLEWSEESDEEEDEFEVEEDDIEAGAYETLRAEDEDWENAERGV